ncbi:unnamed protein product, partial [Pleuronectes platessa]
HHHCQESISKFACLTLHPQPLIALPAQVVSSDITSEHIAAEWVGEGGPRRRQRKSRGLTGERDRGAGVREKEGKECEERHSVCVSVLELPPLILGGCCSVVQSDRPPAASQ